ncbi:transmembrane protein 53-like [Impatiens glandulifera]|uniref:transmembrane protein 53-like n=1 Tax=Impatiens glandulifera TaxID=253017 RepID=UPI001FB171E9|nr:transmembrane protein 53-like [Impatiens glandulifera]
MESSARIFSSPNLTRHLRTSLVVFLKPHQSSPPPNKHPPPFIIRSSSTWKTSSPPPIPPFCCIRASHHHPIFFSHSHRVSGKFGLLFNSLSSSHITASFHSSDGSVSSDVDNNNKSSDSNLYTIHGGDAAEAAAEDKRPLVTAVLMGWLGAKPKHLKRYAELYNSRGINSVSFVVSAKEVVDMGKKLEARIESFSREIESWLRDSDKDGRQRFLIFHTFSNTGWLVYGSILEKFQGKKEILDKIKGCVVDSGADPQINPKVWAAGFGTALLRKRSSAVYPFSDDSVETHNKETTTTPLVESMLLALLEKIFTVLLELPYINGRLKKIIDILANKQPYCPQLYLYSTADKVIPYQSIESFIEDQKRKRGGGQVLSFNFANSPHVDHYRNFPEIYSSQLHNFLEASLSKTSSS